MKNRVARRFRAFFLCADKSYYPQAIFPFHLASFHYLIRYFFVTNFVTRITKFVTCVRNFVTAVTKFVTNFFCADSKKYQAESKKYHGGKKNYLRDSSGGHR